MRHRIPTFLLAALSSVSAYASSEITTPEFKPFEFHAYGRLGIITNEKLHFAGQDQGDGLFGAPTSRHVRDTNYLRIQFLGRPAAQHVFNLEAQIDNLAHLTNTWDGAGLNIRNAYLETQMSPDADLWFGARRLEYEDVRLFDRFPLSDTTFYGLGAKFPLLDAPTTVAFGFKNLKSQLNMAIDPNDPAKGNSDVDLSSRDTSLFMRADLGVFHPTLILNYRGERVLAGKPVTTYKQATDDQTALLDQSAPESLLTGKVGASVTLGFEDNGWTNGFVWVEKKAAEGNPTGRDLDTVFGLAGSGYVAIPEASDSLGILYGLMVEHTRFKNAQVRFTVKDDALVPDGAQTSRSGSVVALGLQPVYYLTNRWQLALDLSHTQTSKVASAKPNMTFVTPIVRYASAANALAAPLFFTSVTYGAYETKSRFNTSGDLKRSSITTQTGCEFWF